MDGWNVIVKLNSTASIITKEILQATNGDELIAKIFCHRGFTNPDIIQQMLNPQLYKPTHYNEFPDMECALERIISAIQNKENICVYGDYDVDGVTSTTLMLEGLSKFSDNVCYHVPDRFTEGYGINKNVITNLHEKGIQLIITVDCGISNITEIEHAVSLGMDVVVTDHHKIGPVLPNAHAVVNPKRLSEGHPARNISGCAMAYFVVQGLFSYYDRIGEEDYFLDLVALSLIADVVSLHGENRYLLQKGIPKLFSSNRIGMQALFEVIEKTGKLSNEEDIGFQIAPRINAAGRMASARLPVELLLSKDAEKARSMAEKIDMLNHERKRIQEHMILEAKQEVEEKKKHQTVLILYQENWHHGIIGIAAGKICETYQKPTILLALKEDGETVVGSARSIEGVDIYDLIKTNSEFLLKFGGHTLAAGLSLLKSRVEEFIVEMENSARKKYFFRNEHLVEVDFEIPFRSIDESFLQRIEKAGPYGEGFEMPLLYTQGVQVVSDKRIKNNHHILVLSDVNGDKMSAVKWFGPEEDWTGKTFDIVYKIRKNQSQESSELQLTLEYVIKKEKNKVPAFTGKLIDERLSLTQECILKYPDALFFYEGLTSKIPKGIQTIHRYNPVNANTLVFLSPPSSTDVLKAVVHSVTPQNIVLHFGITPLVSVEGFLTHLMGILKFYINHNQQIEDFGAIAVKLGCEEALLFEGLNILQKAGKVILKKEVQGYRLQRPIHETEFLYYYSKQTLTNALKEKKAYFDFIKSVSLDDFKKYL